jgi:hypothetical protein
MTNDIAMIIYNECAETSSDDSSNDEDEIYLTVVLVLYDNHQCAIPRFRGSILGQERLERDRIAAHVHLYNHYFNPEGTFYNAVQICQVFYMRRVEFNHIGIGLKSYIEYFMKKRDATGKLGLSSI